MASPSNELSASVEESNSRNATDSTGLQPVTGAAFWAAVALPFLHLPLLLVTGLSSRSTGLAFAALVGMNVVALLIGHRHRRD